MGDDEHWRSLSEAGRALAEERFSSERVVPQYERYYEQVLRG
jgi:glycosyltransferase involved in cell wall biosynthesis